MQFRFSQYFIPKPARLLTLSAGALQTQQPITSTHPSLTSDFYKSKSPCRPVTAAPFPLPSTGTLVHVPRQQGPPPTPHPSEEDLVHRYSLTALVRKHEVLGAWVEFCL